MCFIHTPVFLSIIVKFQNGTINSTLRNKRMKFLRMRCSIHSRCKSNVTCAICAVRQTCHEINKDDCTSAFKGWKTNCWHQWELHIDGIIMHRLEGKKAKCFSLNSISHTVFHTAIITSVSSHILSHKLI